MVDVLSVPPVVREFLRELEWELKQIPGVSPEEALSDAREFLMYQSYALERSGEAFRGEEEWHRILNDFGTPKQVARQYGEGTGFSGCKRGCAPGWRICCTRCGRSAPLASVGGIRIGARSVHKYTLGFCRGCKGIRFLRIARDLDETTITDQLGSRSTPAESLAKMHRPILTIVAIGLFVALSLLGSWGLVWAVASQGKSVAPFDRTSALDKLRKSIESEYSYQDLRGLDWKRIFDRIERETNARTSPQEFAKVVAESLREAKDVHLWLKLDGKVIGTYVRDSQLMFNPRVLPKELTTWKQHGKTTLTGILPNKARYVLLSTWEHREPESFEAALQFIRTAIDESASLVIDVRPNAGGDELQARRVASLFVDSPTHYASHQTRSQGVFRPMVNRILEPTKVSSSNPSQDRARRCVVLMGPTNMSSCESFLLMMRAAGIRLVGKPSYGSSGNPKPHDLGGGIELFLPSWKWYDPQGEPLEGKGIIPDLLVEATPSDFAREDPILKRGAAYVQE